MISEKQHEANIRNAQHSTGPATPEGKQAVRFNALKHGLRAAATILPFEDAEEFERLCAEFKDEWKPETVTQRKLVEQLAVHQWLLLRSARLERSIFQQPCEAGQQLALLERFSTQRNRLERAFSKTIQDLIFVQQRRAAPPVRTEKPARTSSVQPPVAIPQSMPPQDPGHVYVMRPDTR